MKDASNVPDLWRMLRDGLPYLTRSEATEVQLALAVSLYAHSKSTDSSSNSNDELVKVSRLLYYLQYLLHDVMLCLFDTSYSNHAL